MEPTRDTIPYPRRSPRQRPSGRATLTRWRRLRATVSTLTWTLGGWLASRRQPRARPADVANHIYQAQTRGMPLRMTEWLRDRLRPSWLRVRHDLSEHSDH